MTQIKNNGIDVSYGGTIIVDERMGNIYGRIRKCLEWIYGNYMVAVTRNSVDIVHFEYIIQTLCKDNQTTDLANIFIMSEEVDTEDGKQISKWSYKIDLEQLDKYELGRTVGDISLYEVLTDSINDVLNDVAPSGYYFTIKDIGSNECWGFYLHPLSEEDEDKDEDKDSDEEGKIKVYVNIDDSKNVYLFKKSLNKIINEVDFSRHTKTSLKNYLIKEIEKI